MEKSVVIRKSEKLDIPQIVQLRMEFLRKDLGETKVDEHSDLNKKTEEFFKKHLNESIDVFVGDINGKIVAALCVFYLELLPRIVSNDSKCAQLVFAYIKPQYMDKELERSLYEKAMKTAKEKGSDVFEIGVSKEDVLRYEEFGFVDCGYPPIQLLLGKNTKWGKWIGIVEENIRIRKANELDIPQLTDMRVQYLCEVSVIKYVKNSTDFEERVKSYLEKHLNEDLEVYVAEINGEIISVYFIIYFDQIPKVGLVNGKVGIPINLYTKPQYRYDGLSEALFEFLAENAEKRGVELLEMEIPKASIPFYEKFGFEPMKVIPVQLNL